MYYIVKMIENKKCAFGLKLGFKSSYDLVTVPTSEHSAKNVNLPMMSPYERKRVNLRHGTWIRSLGGQLDTCHHLKNRPPKMWSALFVI